MAKNVINKRAVAATNIDSYNRSAVATAEIENGGVFLLESVSDTDKEVWKATAPTAASTGLWMAATPEVVTVTDEMGNAYRNITHDPRSFTNAKGAIIDAFLLKEGDIIEMTGANITSIASATDAAYLVPSTGFKLVAATAATTNSTVLKRIKTSTLNIGDGSIAPAAVPTYIYAVTRN